MIQSLAGELGLDVYMISLSRAGLDDTTLQELISFLPDRCIALMEDIDAAFRHDINRELPSADNSPTASPGPTPGSQSRGVTLSGLLNAIDGVAAHEGRLLFATTNHYEALDPALRRPGRMDRHIEFRLASRYQVTEMFQRFYASIIPGSLPPCPEKPSLLDEEDEKKGAAEPDQQRAWQHASLDDQAKKFASRVPERFISMAELQGYLMLHRSSPVSALSSVRGFIAEKENRGRLIRPRVA